jgi:ParB family chromosome partitioning protein
MASKAERLYGAEGLTDAPVLDPDRVVLVTDKSHPLYDPRVEFAPDPSLVASIARSGVIEPIVIRRNGALEDGSPLIEVIDGRQRVTAARAVNAQRREAGREDMVLLPATVRRSKNDDKAFEEMVSANLRVDTDPVTEANKLARYLEDGHEEEDAVIVFGLPNKRALRNMLALVDCSKSVQKAAREGEITLTVARSLSTLPTSEQNDQLRSMREKGQTGKRNPNATKAAQGKARKVRQRNAPKYTARKASYIASVRESIPAENVARIVDVLDWVLKAREDIPDLD